MSQLFLTDLDHTFLRDDLTISDHSKTIWNSMTQNYMMGIATARTYKKSEQFLRGLHINVPMILLDGSLIVTPEKKILDMKIISKSMADEIIHYGSKLGIYPFVLALKDQHLNEAFLYPTQTNDHQKELLTRYKGDDNLQECSNLKAMEDNFKLVYFGEKKPIRRASRELKKYF